MKIVKLQKKSEGELRQREEPSLHSPQKGKNHLSWGR